jgi:AcrR family transcriptional regulator
MTQNLEKQQIKETACKLFRERGYGGVCLNDLVLETGTQASVIDTYFKGKDGLFDLIIKEEIDELLANLDRILNDENTSLSQKIQLIIDCYFTSMAKNESLNVFILREVKMNLRKITGEQYKKLLLDSYFAKQVQRNIEEIRPDYKVSILDVFLDLTSLCVFPLLISPSIEKNDNQEYAISFERHIEERKELIVSWFNTILMLCE